jgi:hypothetical protein
MPRKMPWQMRKGYAAINVEFADSPRGLIFVLGGRRQLAADKGIARGNVQRESRTATGMNIVSSIAGGPASLQTITQLSTDFPAKSTWAIAIESLSREEVASGPCFSLGFAYNFDPLSHTYQ